MNRKQTLKWLEIRRLNGNAIFSIAKYSKALIKSIHRLKIGLLRK